MIAIAILGASFDQCHLIRTAKQMGLKTVCYDRDPRAKGFALADFIRPLDFGDTAAVIRDLEALNAAGHDVRGVITMGSDVPHLLHRIGAHFGWTVPSEETAERATDKLSMRLAWEWAGVEFTKQVMAGPFVVKPRNSAGSRGVSLCSEDFYAERFEPGPQVSTETILWDDRAVTFLADRNYDDTRGFLPQILENGGWFPCSQPPEMQAQIRDLAERAARALGIERGVAKGDVVVSDRGPLMIEMGARLSGGDFSESLVPLGSGVNYVRQAIEIALGEEPSWEELEPKCARVVANRYFFTPPGRLEAVEHPGVGTGTDKLELWYRPGDLLPPIDCHRHRRGAFVVSGDSREEVQAKIDEVYGPTRFRVSGEWVSGDPRRYR